VALDKTRTPLVSIAAARVDLDAVADNAAAVSQRANLAGVLRSVALAQHVKETVTQMWVIIFNKLEVQTNTPGGQDAL
jgi:hypothetical protein